jgi:hypothetical protein
MVVFGGGGEGVLVHGEGQRGDPQEEQASVYVHGI